jgi:dihydroorotate dehydrogenase
VYLNKGIFMKYILSTISLIIFTTLSSSISAAPNESTTNLIIQNLVTYSNQDTVAPAYSGQMVVQFNTITWVNLPSPCANNIVLVKLGDKNLISTILAAYMSKTPVKVFVDDSSPALQDNRCYLRAVAL